MEMPMNRIWLTACALVLALPLVVAAQDKHVPVKVLAPYLDGGTILAGSIDVQNLDVDAWFGKLREALPEAKELKEAHVHVQMVRKMFLDAGAQHVCFTMNMADTGRNAGPLLVIPLKAGADAAALAKLLGQIQGFTTETRNGALIAGMPEVVAGAKQRKAKEIAEIAQAFGDVAAAPTQVVGVAPAEVRGLLAQVMPQLPPPLGGGATKPYADSVEWATIAGDLSAKVKLGYQVKTKDAASAKELDKLLGRALEMALKSAPEAERAVVEKLAEELRPRAVKDRLAAQVDAVKLQAMLIPAIQKMRVAASQSQAANNLKMIGLAMHGYHDTMRKLPAQASHDKKDRPLLSWRVHLLPYLDHFDLYKEFKLDEPWDSEHNKKLIPKMPKVFLSPMSKLELASGKTTYLVPVGKELVFFGPKQMTLVGIADGTSNTILALDADDALAVTWTAPEDYKVDPKDAARGLFRKGTPGMQVVFADGSARNLSANTPSATMWLYFHPADGMPIPRE
jgi:hypothetical protein